MTKKLYEIAADIVGAQATTGPMTLEAFEQGLSRLFIGPAKNENDRGGWDAFGYNKTRTP